MAEANKMLIERNKELIESPCIRQCCLNESDVCVGCFRTLNEIVAWSESDNAGRENILQNAEVRRQSYHEIYRCR